MTRLLQELLQIGQRSPAALPPRRRSREATRAVREAGHHVPGSERTETCAKGYLAGGEAQGADGAAVVCPSKRDDVGLSRGVAGYLNCRLDGL